MSLRTELAELVEWISDLTAPDKAPETQPLVREDWQAVHGDLDRASKTLAGARERLIAAKAPPFLAEFAGDLAHEAEGLALRAHLLSRQAKPKPATKAAVEPEAEAAEPKEPEEEKKAAETEPKHEAAEKVGVERKHPVSEALGSAQRTIGTAREKIWRVEHPDAVTTSFEAELDVLAEMTLSLRQRWDRLGTETAEAKTPEGGS